jgi:translation initiation factor 5B
MAMRKAQEEEMKRLEEEERRREEEEEKARVAEAAREEAAKEAKREKERQRKEELRRSGKLLTRSEKERQRMNQIKLEQLKAAGNIAIGPVNGGDESVGGEEKKRRPDYGKKKRKPAGASSSTDAVAKAADQAGDEGADGEDLLDDWEHALDASADESDAETEALEGVAVIEQAMSQVQVGGDAREEPAQARREKHRELRSPICCILGHVDTGKTKLLDNLRQTNVQEGEAGGITQQIGATYFPVEALRAKTAHLPAIDIEVPGLLVIDTPGHESFTNLRSRGSSLCNIAILVVDVMHGLEPQTLESLNLLKMRKTPFIVALNKIDRLYGWRAHPGKSLAESLALQSPAVQDEFEARLEKTKLAFAEEGLNAEAAFRNHDPKRTVSLVPTSAITGCGVPDMVQLLISLTQRLMSGDLLYLSALECTVLEVKVMEGLGTTIDVILSNGVLREGDRIVVCGLNGPIVTSIRALLTPQPLREMRVKSQYVHHKQVRAALGVKICAAELDKAVAGSQLLVVGPRDSEAELREAVMADLAQMLAAVDKGGQGVCVQASTLGSLEALLAFLRDSKIPVSGIAIGPVHRKDVVRASVMLEQAREYACLLAFDVKVDMDAQDLADEVGVKVFRADIIYHLFDQFTAYMAALTEQRRRDLAPEAVFPCVLRIVPGCVFNKRDPIVLGVDVLDGCLRVGTPLAVPAQGCLAIGRVTSIEVNHKAVECARRGGPAVAIKIECPSYETPKLVGRHFQETDQLVSRISRASIDVLKESFRNDLSKDDWALIVKLKAVLGIK